MNLKHFFVGLFLIVGGVSSTSSFGQSGTYDFTNVAPTVSGGVFSSFFRTNLSASSLDSGTNGLAFNSRAWSEGSSLDPVQFVSFTITPSAGNYSFLKSLSYQDRRSGSGPSSSLARLFIGDTQFAESGDVSPDTSFTTRTFNFGDIITADAISFRFYGWNANSGSGNLTFDNVSTVSDSGSFLTSASTISLSEATTIFAATNAFEIGGSISGGSISKLGTNSVTLSGVNTFTSATVASGTLVLSADFSMGSVSDVLLSGGSLLFGNATTGDRVNNSAQITLSGGRIQTQGRSETLGTLTLSGNSIIDFGAGASVNTLTFANSSSATWTGNLDIYNWTGTAATEDNTDRLVFSSSGLTSTQLNQIRFFSDSGSTLLGPGIFIGSAGQVVPVPEPTTVAGALGLLGVAGWWERRRWASLGRKLMRRAQRVPASVIRNAVLAFFAFLIFGTILFFP